MSGFNVDSFQQFLQRPETQKLLQAEQENALKGQEEYALERIELEKTELKRELLKCSDDVKKIVAPIVKFDMVHRILYNYLNECRKNKQVFSDALSSDTYTRDLLGQLAAEFKTNPDNVHAIEERWINTVLEAKARKDQEAQEAIAKQGQDAPVEQDGQQGVGEEQRPEREEWIPGVSPGKRKLDSTSLASHLTLGEQMRRDGNEAFGKGDLEMALTRYTQGVQLLNWVEGYNEDDTKKVTDMYLIFLKNQALAAFKLNKWNEAVAACNKALEINPDDVKAAFRRGQSRQMLGQLKEAREDFNKILDNSSADLDSIKAVRKALRELNSIAMKHKTKAHKMMGQLCQEGLFSEHRSKPEAEELKKVSKLYNEAMGIHESDEESDLDAEDYNTPKSKPIGDRKDSPGTPLPPTVSPSSSSEPPRLSLEECRALMNDLKELYESASFQSRLKALRKDADYEEHRVLKRLRKVLPEVQGPVLAKYGFTKEQHEDNRKDMEKAVGYWRSREPPINEMSKRLMQSIMGDLWDLDLQL